MCPLTVKAESIGNQDISFAPSISRLGGGGSLEGGASGAYTHHFNKITGVTAGTTIYQMSSDDDGDLLMWSLFSALNLRIPNNSPFTPAFQVGLQRCSTTYEPNGSFEDKESQDGMDIFFW